LSAPPQPGLAAYAGSFFNALERRAPGLLPRLAPVRRALAGLAGAEAACAPALAHGDPHPLNVIWGEAGARPVRALIDWEFAGLRPRTYDAAVVLGCAGFEHPSGLTRAFALGLARTLAEGGLPTAELRLLPLFVLALRLGWLAEWLRKRDAELVAMELEYLDILLDAQARLARVWAGG
jgi:homoserine kinase type II